MTGTTPTSGPGSTRPGERVAGYLFAGPYAVLLLAFGMVPVGYAIVLAFTRGGVPTLANFERAMGDFRYLDTFGHIGVYAIAFLVPSMVLAVGLALLLQSRRPRTVSALNLMYYLPQALTGSAGVILWIFMLTPAMSPVGGLLRAGGFDNLFQVLSPRNLPAVFALIALWTSANGVLLIYAALTSVPREVLEAARLDGASEWRVARYVKLPMIRKWLAYMGILNITATTQVFVEPQLISSATSGAIGDNWAPTQLAWTHAYSYGDFGSAAALTLQLLALCVGAAVLIIRRTDLFRLEI